MPYTDIPIERLNSWWENNKIALANDPTDWDAVRLEVLLENEYNRRGWTIPTGKDGK